MATIASLIVEISAKTEKLKAGLSSATSSVQAFAATAAKSLAAVGAIVATALLGSFGLLTGMINRQAEALDAMSKEAQKVGATFSEFQKLAYAADLAGVSQEGLAGSLKKMNNSLSDAVNNAASPAAEAFKKLGLSADVLLKMNVEERYTAIGEALKGVGTVAEQTSLAMDIFGKSGADSLVLLKSDLRATSKEFEDLGLTITDSQVAAVEAYNDSKTKLATIWDGFLNQITVAVAPAFQKVIEYITEVITKSGGMSVVAEKVAEFMITMAEGFISAFQTVGKVIDWVGEKISGLTGQIQDILDRLHIVGEAIAAGTTDPSVINTRESLFAARQNSPNTGGFLNDLKNSLAKGKDALSNGGNGSAANASDFLKGSVIGQVIEDFTKTQKDVGDSFDMMGAAAQKLASEINESSNKISETIANMEKSAGQSELSRILGLNAGKSDKPLAQSQKFDDLVRDIYAKVTTGAGTQTQTGTFNGKLTSFTPTTAAQDLAALRREFENQTSNGKNTIGMKGALDELTKFVNGQQAQKVTVDINVKADKGFLAEVTTSAELQKAVDDRISQNATDAAKRARG